MKQILLLAAMAALMPLTTAEAGQFAKPAADTIVFSGPIVPGDAREFKKLLDDRVKRLIVNSGGGYIVDSGEMAKEIEKHKLDVAVDRNCYSACANDLFMAGVNKHLSGSFRVGDEMRDLGGVLCMHGGALGRNDNGLEILESAKPEVAKKLARNEIVEIGEVRILSMAEYESLMDQLKQSMKDQLESYARKGINTDVLLAHKKTRKAWACYTKRGLESMGVKNVEGESSSRLPPNSALINGPNLPDPRRESVIDPYGIATPDRID